MCMYIFLQMTQLNWLHVTKWFTGLLHEVYGKMGTGSDPGDTEKLEAKIRHLGLGLGRQCPSGHQPRSRMV